MSAAVTVSFITEEPQPQVQTVAATEDTLASESPYRAEWQSVIDRKLIEWGRDPAQLAEDELIPPTRAALAQAVKLAQTLRDSEYPPPLRVVPDGDGGIVFERWEGTRTEAFEIDRSGRAEFVDCIEGKVIRRLAL